MKTPRRMAALMSSGVLIATLAACGSDDPSVTEAGENGNGTSDTDDGDTDNGDSEGTDEGDTEGTDGGDTEGTDGGDTEGTDGGDTEGSDGGDTEGGGSVAAGTEIDPNELLERLQSVDENTLGSYSMQGTMSAMGESIDIYALADLRGSTPAMSMEMGLGGINIDMIVADGRIFMQMPGLSSPGMYMEVPADEMDDFGDIASGIDLESQWDAWESGAQSVRFIGREDVNGEEMDHFALAVDASAALAADPSLAEDGIDLPDTIEYELWVDDSNLMRKMAFSMDDANMEVLVDNWGESFDIQAPPEDQIEDFDLGF